MEGARPVGRAALSARTRDRQRPWHCSGSPGRGRLLFRGAVVPRDDGRGGVRRPRRGGAGRYPAQDGLAHRPPPPEAALAVVPRVFWSAVPLRQVVRSVSTSQQVAVLLDRRADPDQALDFTLNDVTVEGLLRRIAKDCGLGITMVGPVTYLGPTAAAARLRTIALLRKEEAEKLPAEAGRAWLHSEPLAWDDFARPRELLRGLASAAGIEISGLEQVPHDLWASADLPPLTLVERLTLIAEQFNLTFRVVRDGQGLELVPIPDDLAIVRRYPGGKDPARLAEQWSALVPQAQVKRRGVRSTSAGSSRTTNGSPAARGPPRASAERTTRHGQSEMRYTVNHSKGPLDRLLRELAERLQVTVKIDENACARPGSRRARWCRSASRTRRSTSSSARCFLPPGARSAGRGTSSRSCPRDKRLSRKSPLSPWERGRG